MTSIIDECPSNLNMRRRILSSEFIGTIYLMSWNRVKYVPCILHHCITAVKYERAQINICTEPLHSTGLDGHFSVSAWGVRWCRWCEVWCRVHYEKIDLFSISCRIFQLQVTTLCAEPGQPGRVCHSCNGSKPELCIKSVAARQCSAVQFTEAGP